MGIRKRKPPISPVFEEKLGPSKNLIVGSVYAKDDSMQRQWLDLQLSFLKATTQDFDHIALLYSPVDSDYFSSRTETIRIAPFTSDSSSVAHATGLRILNNAFQSRRKIYKHFLFLDSDAFPIRDDWQSILLNKMEHHTVAMPVRTEDLETRPHASILFAKDDILDSLDFKVGVSGKDLIGNIESDILAGKFQRERDEIFTLIRSNKFNIHPALCGIYYDCFYHHCCGSGRAYNLRSRDYWDVVCDKDINVHSYTQELMANPSEFIRKLAGWSPERYANERDSVI